MTDKIVEELRQKVIDRCMTASDWSWPIVLDGIFTLTEARAREIVAEAMAAKALETTPKQPEAARNRSDGSGQVAPKPGTDTKAWLEAQKNPQYRPRTLAQKLGYLTEECGEVLAAVGKTQRWGPEGTNPEPGGGEPNWAWVLRELDDPELAIGIVRRALLEVKESQ